MCDEEDEVVSQRVGFIKPDRPPESQKLYDIFVHRFALPSDSDWSLASMQQKGGEVYLEYSLEKTE